MKKILSAMLAAALAVCLAACETIDAAPMVTTVGEVPQNYPVTVGNLEFEEAPGSVISLSPALTEIIYELGYGYALCAVGEYCDYPEEAAAMPEAGSAANPDTETIIRLKPDLLISGSPVAKKDISAMEDAGIRVLVLPQPEDYDSLRACYCDIAELFGGSEKAEEKTAAAFEELDGYIAEAKSADISFIYIMSYGITAATPDTFAGNILSAYGKNIAEGYSDCTMPAEDIIAADPDFVILAAPRNAVNLGEGLSALPAVQEGRVISVYPDRFERPTTRVGDNFRLINAALSAAEMASEENAEDTSAELAE